MRKGTNTKAWTTRDIDWLKLTYGVLSTEELALTEGRTVRAIQAQANRQGLDYWQQRILSHPVF